MPQLFQSVRLANWRQFRQIDIEFHERLTIITGANGAGKTTILNLLSRHFGWQGNLVSTPRRYKEGNRFSPDTWTDEELETFAEHLDEKWSKLEPRGEAPAPSQGPPKEIGMLRYGTGVEAPLYVPAQVGNQFQIEIRAQQSIAGMHIPSHRPIFAYQTVENIPTVPRQRDQAYSGYLEIVRNRHYGGHSPRTPNYYLKETLIAMAAFGAGNEYMDQNEESRKAFEGFQEILRKVLPPSLKFLRISIRLPEVILVTRTGDISIDAVSGGIASIIDLAWQVFMYAKEDMAFAVTIDEPENHLHPELQRTVLGSLLDAFPKTQFICATHNPFVVTSVPESNVYALRYGDDDRVVSQSLSMTDRSGSSNDILRDVLGVPSTMPAWVDAKLDAINEQLTQRDLTPALVAEMRQLLSAAGLERFIPKTLANLAAKKLANDQSDSSAG